jgi:hypothetical protein
MVETAALGIPGRAVIIHVVFDLLRSLDPTTLDISEPDRTAHTLTVYAS